MTGEQIWLEHLKHWSPNYLSERNYPSQWATYRSKQDFVHLHALLQKLAILRVILS